MSGFSTNAKTIHEGHKESGFVRANAKGKRHRWDLRQASPKPGTPKPPKAPALQKLEEPEMDMMDGPMTGMPPDGPDDEAAEMGGMAGMGMKDKKAPGIHHTVNVNLDPRALAAFKGFNAKGKGKGKRKNAEFKS